MSLKELYGSRESIFLPLFSIWVLWGIVPGCAKLSNLPGDLLCLWVNWIAVFSLLLVVLITRQWHGLLQNKNNKPYNVTDYLKVSVLGLCWPFLYSLAFFSAIYESGPVFTTILSYSFPIFALLFGYIFFKKKVSFKSYLGVLFAIFGISTGVYLGNNGGIIPAIPIICMGLFAGMSQGLYISITSQWQKYNPLMITFVISVVTAISVTILVGISGNFYIPSPKSIFFAAVIGIFGNALGFLIYTYGNQLANRSSKDRGIWLSGLCFILISQFMFSVFFGIDVFNPYYTISVVFITIGLIINSKSDKY